MFGRLFDVLKDVSTVVLAPVEIALDLTKAITKPLADGATEIVQTVKDLTDQD